MDGVELIRRLRIHSQLPIIVISARSEDSDKIAALDAGADDYLTKPFSVEELLARVRATQRRLLFCTVQAPIWFLPTERCASTMAPVRSGWAPSSCI